MIATFVVMEAEMVQERRDTGSCLVEKRSDHLVPAGGAMDQFHYMLVVEMVMHPYHFRLAVFHTSVDHRNYSLRASRMLHFNYMFLPLYRTYQKIGFLRSKMTARSKMAAPGHDDRPSP